MIELHPPRPVTGSLGPNQLDWCRANIRGFAVMEQQANRAREAIESHRHAMAIAVNVTTPAAA